MILYIMKNEIRLIGGIYKNHLIKHSDMSNTVRATKILLRKSLFDIAFNYLENNFTLLDACAGYGTIGLEALSRGASLVVFCDINMKCIKSIRENVQNMPKVIGESLYIQRSVLKIIDGKPMNCVFIDPPYASAHIIYDIIRKLHATKWIDINTLIIFEADAKSKFVDTNNVYILRDKKIGNSVLYFAKYIENVIVENHI